MDNTPFPPTISSSIPRPWPRLAWCSTWRIRHVVAIPPAGHSLAHKVARRSERAALARREAVAAQRWADVMPPCRIRMQAEKLADARYERAEAWFWLAGGDAAYAGGP